MKSPFMIAAMACAVIAFAGSSQEGNPFLKGVNPFEKAGNVKKTGWEGQEVIGKWSPNKIKFWDIKDEKRIDYELSGHFPLTVIRDDGDKLRVEDDGREGWISRNDVVLKREGVVYFTDRIDGNPNDAHAYLARGCARQESAWEANIKDFSECIRLAPDTIQAYRLRARSYELSNSYLAFDDYLQILRLKPDDAVARSVRAGHRNGKKDFPGAIEDYSVAIKSDPKNPNYYLQRSNVYARLKDIDKQIADCDSAIELKPSFHQAFVKRGLARANRLDYKAALQDIDDALRLEPEHDWYLYYRACLLLVQNDEGCVAAFEKARETEDGIHSHDPAVLYSYFAFRQIGQLKSAASVLKSAAEEFPAGTELNLVKYFQGELTEEKLLETAGKDLEVEWTRCALGVDFMLKGEAEAAKKHFRWIIDKGDPSHVDFTIAVGMLDRIEKEKAAPKKK